MILHNTQLNETLNGLILSIQYHKVIFLILLFLILISTININIFNKIISRYLRCHNKKKLYRGYIGINFQTPNSLIKHFQYY